MQPIESVRLVAGQQCEHLFALCHLLGIEFMPRIKDLAD
ncbi:MAG: Tn3 family transposase, partial [Acidobacteriaceae bacterium]